MKIHDHNAMLTMTKGEDVKASKQKTSVVKGTPNPVFNETIKYKLPFPKGELPDHRLSIAVCV